MYILLTCFGIFTLCCDVHELCFDLYKTSPLNFVFDRREQRFVEDLSGRENKESKENAETSK